MERLVYMFDVDGTLTPPRSLMDKGFASRFLQWMRGKDVYIVAGSDYSKVKEQVSNSILIRCKGIFCCSGNELWKEGGLIYKNKWSPSKDLITLLKQLYQSSHFSTKGNSVIENRTGMVNFSIIGREAKSNLREIYHKWDIKNKERQKFAAEIIKLFPSLEAKIGGQISIDIYPKGQNKSKASQWIRKNIGAKMIFFGDKCSEDGNDYPIVQDIKLNNDGYSVCVNNCNETLNILTKEH